MFVWQTWTNPSQAYLDVINQTDYSVPPGGVPICMEGASQAKDLPGNNLGSVCGTTYPANDARTNLVATTHIQLGRAARAAAVIPGG